MKEVPVVIFRLPSNKIQYAFYVGMGEDKFYLHPFGKDHKSYLLEGRIMECGDNELKTFADKIELNESGETESIGEQDYKDNVLKACSEIREGRFDKVVLASFFWRTWTNDIKSLYKSLELAYPDAFVYVFNVDGLVMTGASPETLIRKFGNQVFTEALGGTAGEDGFRNKELLEHRQISTFIEEQLKLSSLQYESGETRTRKAGNIRHLLTEFTLEDMKLQQTLDLAVRLHPTPAVCGVPRKEAFNFIEQSEPFSRRYYAGFLGPVFGKGDCHLSVNLRCAECYKDRVKLFAGAGINAFSDPDEEWREINSKAETIQSMLK